MDVRVNGKTESVEPGVTIAGFLETKGLAAQRVAVELNMAIVKKESYGSTRLSEGDSVEIVHFVGGG
ncbi:MAG: sulfur carrier protein ThiS [Chitinivibrionales bacterium]|nr:sulfur carrier protein ThiS [Chitinivibrionales bacterium]